MIRYAIYRPDGDVVVASSLYVAEQERRAGAKVVEFEWDGPYFDIPRSAVPEPPGLPLGWSEDEVME